ncbi:MAG: hypothetical protein F4Y50_03755 [Dehalococcoidia bacterium]|nr:hypothetical protein [Dehalococcoidia bacterium]
MPNPTTHMEMAYLVARRVDADVLNENMGCYLLGSTAPDVRVVTRRGREPYHFAPLDFDKVGAGITGLFREHPQLAETEHGPTRSFMAGYMTHLTLDETWIIRMYRPLFGVDGVFATEAEGAVMDRVMQMELDTLALERLDVLKTHLASFGGGVGIPFIDGETLSEWHEWVTSFISNEFTWERLRFMAMRISRGDETHPAHAIADDFVRGMPDTLDVLHETVPAERLVEFKRDAIADMARVVAEHLA